MRDGVRFRHSFNAIVCAAVMVALALSLSCGGDSQALLRGELLEAEKWPYRSRVNLQISPDEGNLGYMTVSAITVKGQHALDEAVAVDRASALEYTPFVTGVDANTQVTLEVFARVDGEDVLLATQQPEVIEDMERDYRQLAPLPLTRIDLSRFAGKTVRLKWVVRPADSAAEVRLMDLRVKPISKVRPPDILVVCSDTHRFDYSLGHPGKELMPRLGEFGAGASTYTSAYATASWTLPSVSSLYTGRWPRFHRTGVRVRSVEPGKFERSMLQSGQFHIEFPDVTRIMTTFSRSMPTIQSRLREYGYKTVLVNANALYVLAGLSTAGFSAAMTFDKAPGDRLNALAADYIRHEPDGQPLFLVVHYMDVHGFGLLSDDVLPEGLTGGEETARGKYRHAVKMTDGNLGDLLSVWNASRPLDNSLVIFYADHGEHLLEPGEISGEPATYHGTTMDDALLHVPLVVSYPGRAGAGEILTEPVSLVDIPRTILDVIGGADESGTFQGESLRGDGRASERMFFADYQFIGDSLGSARQGSAKLVLNLENDKRYELNCGSQPCKLGSEWQAPAPEENALHSAYWSYTEAAEQFDTNDADRHSVSPDEALKHLKSLGYVQ